jgi:hypothetical protein
MDVKADGGRSYETHKGLCGYVDLLDVKAEPTRGYVDMSIYWMLKQVADVVMKPTRD